MTPEQVTPAKVGRRNRSQLLKLSKWPLGLESLSKFQRLFHQNKKKNHVVTPINWTFYAWKRKDIECQDHWYWFWPLKGHVGLSSLNFALFQQQVAASPHSPSLRAFDTTLAADLLMTWTTYSGQLTAWAMVMARWVASASTSSGRHSSWASGPVMPIDSIFFAPCRVPAGMGTTRQHKG